MSPSEIAERLGVRPGTVRSWKSRGKWSEKCNATDSVATLVATSEARRRRKAQTRKKIAQVIDESGLTEREKNFCLAVISCWNYTQAAFRAGYTGDYNTVKNTAYELMRREDVKAEIKRLKAIKREQILADGDDLLELAQRVVFSDITDIAKFKGSTVKLKSDQEVDGQLIKKVGSGRYGPTVELKDERPYLELLVRITGLDQTDADRDALSKVSELLAGFDEEALQDGENDA